MGQAVTFFRVARSTSEDEINIRENHSIKIIGSNCSIEERNSESTISTVEKSLRNRYISTSTSIRSQRTSRESPQASLLSPPPDDASSLSICRSSLLINDKNRYNQMKEKIRDYLLNITMHDSESLKLFDSTIIAKNVGRFLDKVIGKDLRSKNSPNTKFDAISIPDITIEEYFLRIVSFFKCSSTCHIIGIIYISKLLQKNPDFKIDLLNAHRIILLANVLASKFLDDHFMYNSFYAQVGGISTLELNKLEIRFLDLIEYKLFVSQAEIQYALEKFIDYDGKNIGTDFEHVLQAG